MSTAKPILPSLSPAPTALDIARAELNAAEEAYAQPPDDRSRAELAKAVIAARKGYAAAFWAEQDGGAE